MAGRESLQFPRGNHRARAGPENFLVFRDDFYLYFIRELVWPDPRRRHDWLGSLRSDWNFSHRSAAFARWQRRSEHDDGDGCHFLFALDRLGPSSARRRRFFKTSLCPKRRDHGSFENPDGSDFLHGRLARSDFDSFPADFAELSTFWKHLRR